MSNRGFTLVEVIITIAISSIILVCLTEMVFFMDNQQKNMIARIELQQNLTMALDSIAADVENSRDVIGYGDSNLLAKSLNLRKVRLNRQGETYDQRIDYQLAIDPMEGQHLFPLKGKVLYRKTDGGQNQPIANFIIDLTFEYLDSDNKICTNSHQAEKVIIMIQGEVNNDIIQYQQVKCLEKKRWP